MLQIHNGIPIREFNGDKSDKVLKSLYEYLMLFKDIDDVRDKIAEDFDLPKLVDTKIAPL